jgi:ABC-type multidrug transport system fused ATPase/permease subunit
MSIKQTLARLAQIGKPFYGAMALALLAIIIEEAASLAPPYLYGRLIDAVIAKESLEAVLGIAAIAFGTYLFTSVIFGYLGTVAPFSLVTMPLLRHIHELILEKTMAFSMGQHENANSGVKQSVITRGVGALNDLIELAIFNVLPTVIQITAVIVFLAIMSPLFSLIMLAGVAAFTASSLFVNNRFWPRIKKSRKLYQDNDKLLAETLHNITLIKLNSREALSSKEFLDDFQRANEFSRHLWLKILAYFFGNNSIIVIARFAALALGAYMIYRGQATPGFVLIVFSWTWSAFERVLWIGQMQRRFLESWSRARKLLELMEIEPEVREAANPKWPAAFAGRIQINDLWFRYPAGKPMTDDEDEDESPEKIVRENTPVLRGINLDIGPGETVAIVGPSGAGKSTLIKLLVRAYDPDRGQILVDGHDLRELDLKKFREAVGMVPQDIMLFDQSLRYNILLGMNGQADRVSEAELDEAVRLSCVDRFSNRLTQGYDTVIGERGIKLSGGERQRVAIARALVKRPATLIFDEATSHLDTENEAAIRESIRHAAKGRTTIIIAHRFSTVRVADRIVVMEHGRIVGQGGHNELLIRCPTYRRLIENQTIMIGA